MGQGLSLTFDISVDKWVLEIVWHLFFNWALLLEQKESLTLGIFKDDGQDINFKSSQGFHLIIV